MEYGGLLLPASSASAVFDGVDDEAVRGRPARMLCGKFAGTLELLVRNFLLSCGDAGGSINNQSLLQRTSRHPGKRAQSSQPKERLKNHTHSHKRHHRDQEDS